jgi:hypothetical protein
VRWLPPFVLALLLAPSPALAWTDASVRSARAQLTIDEHAHAHVIVEVTLRVDRGWLEGFELDGLDPDLVLDPMDPVTLVRAAPLDAGAPLAMLPSEAFAPRVEVHSGGRIALSLPRRGAPRRGDYLVHVAYDTSLAGRATTTTADGVAIRWTFPAWRYGLDSVEVQILAPAGASVAPSDEDEIGIEQAIETDGARITLTRAHLARTRDWPIDVLVPLRSVDPSLAIVPTAEAAAALVSAPATQRPWHGAIALFVASILVALRVSRSRARARSERSVEHPLIPIPPTFRLLAILLLGAAMAVLDRQAPVLAVALAAMGIALLASSRRAPSVLPPKLGSFRHATPTLLRAAKRASLVRALSIDAWLDATTLPGLVVLALLALLVLTVVPEAEIGPAILALALVTHAFLVDARAVRPEPALVTLHRLVRFARKLRVSLDGPHLAFLPVLHLGASGEAHEARLRVVSELPTDVLRVDVAPIARGLFGARFGLIVVTRVGGPSDLALVTDSAFRELAKGSERIARVLPIHGARVDLAFATLRAALSTPAVVEPERAAA